MKNEYEVNGDITFISIKTKNNEFVRALIDTSDLEKTKEFPNSWIGSQRVTKANKFIYVSGGHKGKTFYLHRWLMNPPSGLVVDHINCNPLDNMDADLIRECTENLKSATGYIQQANEIITNY